MKTFAKNINVAKTPLETFVQEWINNTAEEYTDTGVNGVLEDLFIGGCASGYVSILIYYKDTVKFYQKYDNEIWDILHEQSIEQGQSPLEFIANLNGSKDVGNMEQFQNLLAWFAFEETARILAERSGIEL